MSKEPIPRGLEYLHEKYMSHEMIEWKKVQPGTEIVLEAYDRNTGNNGYFTLTVMGITEAKNGLLDVTMAVGETEMWVTEDTVEREVIHLPAGTLLKNGASARYFPDENATMTYFGGISVNRDCSFGDVLLPDGQVINGILIPQVTSILSFQPEADFEPTPLDEYDAAIRAHKEVALSEHEKAVIELDKVILERATALFPDENTKVRDELLAQINTFNPEGKFTLLNLMEHSNDQGVLDRFNDVLRDAIEEEFSYMHPQVRGMHMIPANQRGMRMMVRELGLKFE